MKESLAGRYFKSGFLRIDKVVLIIFALSMILRLGYLYISIEQTSLETIASSPSDSREYVQLGMAFAGFEISSESILYMVGFGYPLFLGMLFLVSSKSLLFALIIQSALASATTAIIYIIGMMVLKKRIPSIIAVAINGLSITSLTMSVSFLSETLFFFFLVLSLYFILKCIDNPTYFRLTIIALLITCAAFTRSVGQFLPIIIFTAVIITPARFLHIPKKIFVLKFGLAMIASLILIYSWAVRNYVVHNTFVTAGTGAGAAALYLGTRAAKLQSGSPEINYREAFINEMNSSKEEPLTIKEKHDWYINKVKSLFYKNPPVFIMAYFSIVGENFIAYEDNCTLRVPKYAAALMHMARLCQKMGIDLIILALSVVGMFLLAGQRQYFLIILLVMTYIYFMALSGFTLWQGSRIMYPAQICWLFPLSLTLYRLGGFIRNIIFRAKQSMN
jgi:4-amino-4-deoxy-L-arabinose transferase-like glycosyltransferase